VGSLVPLAGEGFPQEGAEHLAEPQPALRPGSGDELQGPQVPPASRVPDRLCAPSVGPVSPVVVQLLVGQARARQPCPIESPVLQVSRAPVPQSRVPLAGLVLQVGAVLPVALEPVHRAGEVSPLPPAQGEFLVRASLSPALVVGLELLADVVLLAEQLRVQQASEALPELVVSRALDLLPALADGLESQVVVELAEESVCVLLVGGEWLQPPSLEESHVRAELQAVVQVGHGSLVDAVLLVELRPALRAGDVLQEHAVCLADLEQEDHAPRTGHELQVAVVLPEELVRVLRAGDALPGPLRLLESLARARPAREAGDESPVAAERLVASARARPATASLALLLLLVSCAPCPGQAALPTLSALPAVVAKAVLASPLALRDGWLRR